MLFQIRLHVGEVLYFAKSQNGNNNDINRINNIIIIAIVIIIVNLIANVEPFEMTST